MRVAKGDDWALFPEPDPLHRPAAFRGIRRAWAALVRPSGIPAPRVSARGLHRLCPSEGAIRLGVTYAGLATAVACLVLAQDELLKTTWEAEPDRAFTLYWLAALNCALCLPIIVAHWHLARSPRLASGPRCHAVLAGFAWTVAVACTAASAWNNVPYGISLAARVEQERSRPGVEISPDGTEIAMRRGFALGLTKRIKGLLRERPGIRTVVLSGPGGAALEGWRLARLIRGRGLDTRVQDRCLSACALAFLAGRHRTLLSSPEKGLLGFHPPWARTEGGVERRPSDDLDEDMRASGASEGFVRRINDTPITDMWRPMPSELAAGGVPVTLLGPYDVPGTSWGSRGLSRDATLASIDPRGTLVRVLEAKDTDVLTRALDWVMRARGDARNERMVRDRYEEFLGRVIALRMSAATDADALRAGTYVRAAMERLRDTSSTACARLGARPNLLIAATVLPGPPGAASDPDDPYGALLGRAYAGAGRPGRPGGIALPDVASPLTWASRLPLPVPGEGCAQSLAWYDAMTRPGSVEGASALRGRFAAFAASPVVTEGEEPAHRLGPQAANQASDPGAVP